MINVDDQFKIDDKYVNEFYNWSSFPQMNGQSAFIHTKKEELNIYTKKYAIHAQVSQIRCAQHVVSLPFLSVISITAISLCILIALVVSSQRYLFVTDTMNKMLNYCELFLHAWLVIIEHTESYFCRHWNGQQQCMNFIRLR